MDRFKLGLASALCVFALPVATTSAQTSTWKEGYKQVLPSTAIEGLQADRAFGEEISLYTGEVSFARTDISIPGNDQLEVALRWRMDLRETQYPTGSFFIDLPRMEGVYPTNTGWTRKNLLTGATGRCSSGMAAPPLATGGSTMNSTSSWDPGEFWSGDTLKVPGRTEDEVLSVLADGAQLPTDGAAYKWVTKSGWRLSCIPAKNDPGEGFLAISPDGVKYYFDTFFYKSIPQLNRAAGTGPAPIIAEKSTQVTQAAAGTAGNWLQRSVVTIYVSKVVDRFGNSVNYTYDTSGLTGISSSDGRTIAISRPSAGIVTATAGGRIWTYGPGNVARLPDSSTWEYTVTPQAVDPFKYSGGGNYGSLATAAQACDTPPTATGSGTVTVKTPSNAVATYSLSATRHGRSYVPRTCLGYTLPDGGYMGYVHRPYVFETRSLISKTVSGPGLAPATWQYSYGPPNNSWESSCSGGCAATKTVTVTDPKGTQTRHTFSNRFQQGEGQELAVEVIAPGGAVLERQDNIFLFDPTGQPYPARVGRSGNARGDRSSEFINPLVQRTISRDGATFTRSVYGVDSFARPLIEVETSSLGVPARTTTTTYYDDLSKWVVGQRKSSTNSETGLVIDQTDFDPATALPIRFYSFGVLQTTASYWPDGSLNSTTDANGNSTTYGDYYRGVPRLIRFADSKTVSAGVSPMGQVEWIANEVGAKTCYEYDLGGRLTKTTYPSENAQTPNVCDTSWTPTTINYSQVGVDQYGLGAGHWVQQIKTGAGVKNTFFDALWRPVVEETFDENAIAATLSQKVTRYDAAGQIAFTSYPTQWISNYASVTQGVRNSYDALGRPVRVEQDSELGVLASTTEYLANFTTRTTNPRGFQTTTTYKAWGQPSTDWPSVIVEPEDTTTEIVRDPFGKPTQMRRRNGSGSVFLDRYYTYDAAQRLCKTIEPETASTVYNYDAAGNLTWSAGGLSLNSLAGGVQCDADRGAAFASGRSIERGYDARNRLTWLKFPDGRGDQALAYSPDGLLDHATTWNDLGQTSPVTNSYAYNRRRLLIEEHSAQPGAYVDWGLVYGYDANGFQTSQRFPDGGSTIFFGLNALGQTTGIWDHAGNVYARDVSYYPNGAIRQFFYGNGIQHDMSQNARQLPAVVVDNNVTAMTYAYDANGNPTAIRHVDATQFNYTGNRDMVYDGRDRLTQAHLHWWMIDDYTYDVLDNITSKLRTTGAGATARTYVYNNANQLMNLVDTATGASVSGLGYDPQGNLANKDGQQYRFDYGNRLRAVDGKGAYRYDAHGRRALASSPNGNVRSIYDRNGSLAYDLNVDANKATYYIYLSGSLIATREAQNGNVVGKFHHTDALGSPIGVTDQDKRVIDQTFWEPYGAAINKPVYEGVGYTGHVMDGATGLTYMQQRYYDPMIGRFASVDPVTALDGGQLHFNRYGYAYDNPYKFTDPDGRCPICFLVAVAAMYMTSGPANAPVRGEQTSAMPVGDQIASAIPAGGRAVAFLKFGIKQSGRNANKLKPDPRATGSHSTIKRDQQGNTTNTATYETNSKNPSGFQETKRVDVTGKSHTNPDGTVVPPPHVQEAGQKGVRPARPDELPKKS